MSTDPFTAAELVAAYQGREGIGLAIAREAEARFTAIIEQNALASVQQAVDAGISLSDIAAAIKSNGDALVPKTHTRTTAQKPTAPADDSALFALLCAELDKGAPLTAKALARRTGATTERVTSVLRRAQDMDVANEGQSRLALHGLKWSRKAAT